MDDQNMYAYGEHYAEITEAILRDVCELEPANPSLNDTICVDVSDLKIIVDRALRNAQVEAAATAPLLARIAELESNFKDMSNRRTKYLNETVALKERIAALTAQVEQAAQPAAWRFPKAGVNNGYHYTESMDGEEPRFLSAWTPLYTEPPKAVPLTVPEVEQILARWSYELHGDRARYIVRETELAHGITPATVEKGETP